MYRKQTNKTALRSQQMMADAVFRLMKSKSFASLTITEICGEAGVGRKTFYRNFELKEDVIEFWLDELCRSYETDLPLEQRLGYHFKFLQKYADELIVLYRHGLSDMVNAKFSVFLPVTMPLWSEDPTEQLYRSEYISAGITAIVKTWVTRGFQESLDEIVEIALRAQGDMIPIAPDI